MYFFTYRIINLLNTLNNMLKKHQLLLDKLGINDVKQGACTGTEWIDCKGDLTESVSPIHEALIAKVKNATADDYEYIIVDGGSIDGTVEIIEKHLNNIDIFISEADKGIYDAMNKGIRVSSGEFVVFINCGDRLLKLPFKELSQNRDSSINCFPVYLSNMIKFYPENNWKLKIRNRLPHQGCYYKNSKELIYDLSYKVYSDFDLNQKY